MIVRKNILWDKMLHPTFTIITPVYNRRDTIQRTLVSVEKQTYKNIEYIIIDDGSTDNCDDIIEEYMKSSVFPVMYIKKENGGVHSARNVGFKFARGELLINIDSDDELLPKTCEVFLETWKAIPSDKKERIWQIKALCETQNGTLCSKKFPSFINELPVNQSIKYFSLAQGEQIGCRVTSILKENLFPEPDYVNFVNECVIWVPLEQQYMSWGLNKVLRIYHTDGNNSLTRTNNKTVQSCINAFWNSLFVLNNSEIFIQNKKEYLKTLVRYCIMYHIIKKAKPKVIKKYKLNDNYNKIFITIMFLPTLVGAYIYKIKKM